MLPFETPRRRCWPCFTRSSPVTCLYQGVTERQLSDEVRHLANEVFGVRRFWHKRIVRAGVNTLEPYRFKSAEPGLEVDNIVFFDLGPIFEDWEADVGRTYVLGDDEHKHRFAADLPVISQAAHDHSPNAGASPEDRFTHVLGLVAERCYSHGARHEAHLVGEFPHERLNDDQITCYISNLASGLRRVRPGEKRQPILTGLRNAQAAAIYSPLATGSTS